MQKTQPHYLYEVQILCKTEINFLLRLFVISKNVLLAGEHRG